MRIPVPGALAGAVLLAAVLAWGDENPPAAEPAGVSDEEVARLVEQMSSPKFRTRQEAFEKLKSLGAGVVAKLEPYRNHEDPEARRRVRGLIDVYQWARTGRLISTIEKGTQAERLGIRVGDVVVKVGEVDIVKAKDFKKAPEEAPRAYYILRGGRILTFNVGPGRVGFTHAPWYAERGGNDHAQAYVALAAGNLEEAYKRLKKAHQAGQDSFRTVLVLSGLAEYNLEHEEAMRYYMIDRKRNGDDNCWLSHRNLEGEFHGLPVSGPHAAWLLGRLKKEKFNPELYHQAEDWFTFHGINLPLARELIRTKWPHDAGTLSQRSRHFTTKMRIALHDRDYDAALKGYRLWPDTEEYPFIPQLAVRAAVTKGDLDTAAKAAVDVLNSYRKGEASAGRACVALYAVAAAAASGNEYLAERLLGEMSRLEPEQLDKVLNYVTHDTWRHGAVIPHVAAFWRRNPLDGSPGKSNYLRLYMLSCSADLRPSLWRKQYRRYQSEKTERGYFWLNAVAMMRFGAYDEAQRALRRYYPNHAAVKPFMRAIALLKENSERLEGDWSQLKGVHQVYEGSAEGTLWAVRWDGATFFIDAEGKVHEYPGLAPGQLHEGCGADCIHVFATGTVYLRRAQFYLLDEDRKRWRRTWAAPGVTREAYWKDWADETFPVVLRYILKHLPHEGTGREILYKLKAGRWQCYQFNGDIALAVRVGEGGKEQVIDLGTTIAKLAGKAKGSPGTRVDVYRTGVAGESLLIPTEAGLWRMDAEGGIARVELPLEEPNVMMVLLNYPTREGKLYVGVVPQQGGQVFELDEKTLAALLTGGFCGFGPQDAYSVRQRLHGDVQCEYAIQRIYEERLAREKAGGK